MDSPNYLCTIEASKEYHMPIEKVYQKPYELWFSIHDPNRHGQPTTNMGIESFEYSVDQAHNEAVHLQVIWLHFEVIYHFFCYLSFKKKKTHCVKFDLICSNYRGNGVYLDSLSSIQILDRVEKLFI